jgi:hypothetical protein
LLANASTRHACLPPTPASGKKSGGRPAKRSVFVQPKSAGAELVLPVALDPHQLLKAHRLGNDFEATARARTTSLPGSVRRLYIQADIAVMRSVQIGDADPHLKTETIRHKIRADICPTALWY